MHLWPSTRIRDSFKISYLKNLEWNLQRMNNEKRTQSNRQTLLEGGGVVESESVISINGGEEEGVVGSEKGSSKMSKISGLCREVVMVLSCCYCCFCCGACLDQEEK